MVDRDGSWLGKSQWLANNHGEWLVAPAIVTVVVVVDGGLTAMVNG